MSKYYLAVSSGIKLAVVDSSTKQMFWWDGLPAESKEESQDLPRWDINRQAWLS